MSVRILSRWHFILRSPKNVSQILNQASLGLIPSALAMLITGFVSQLLLIFNITCRKQLTWHIPRAELWTDSCKHLAADPDLSFAMTTASTRISAAASVYGVCQCSRRWTSDSELWGSWTGFRHEQGVMAWAACSWRFLPTFWCPTIWTVP